MELDTKSTAGNGDQVEEVSTVGGKLDDGGQETMTGTNNDKRTNNYDGTGVLRSPSVLAPVVENAGSKCTRKEKHTSTYCLNQGWAMLLDKMACGYASEDLGTYGFRDSGERSQATVYKKPQLDGPQETDASRHQTRQVSIIVQENEGVQHRRSFSGIQVLVRDDLEQGIIDESEKGSLAI